MFWRILIGERKGPVKYYGERADEGHLYMHVYDQKQSWMVSLLIVGSGTEATVRGILATFKQLHFNSRNQ